MRLPKLKNILAKTNNKCCYCGSNLALENATRDHLTPICKGGKHGSYNLLASCFHCNHLKDNMTLPEFKNFVQNIAKKDKAIAYSSALYRRFKTKPYFYFEELYQKYQNNKPLTYNIELNYAAI